MKYSKYVPILIILGVASLAWWFFGDWLNFQTLSERHEALRIATEQNFILASALFILLYALITALSLPGATFATLAGGLLFGLMPGALWNVMGATIGATCIFMAVKYGFGREISDRASSSTGQAGRIKAALDNNQWSVLFIIRLVPFIPFFLANILPGLANVPVHRFVISTFIGIMPGALVYTSMGASLGELIQRGQEPDLGLIFSIPVLLPLLGLAALAALPIFLKPLLQRRGLITDAS